MVSIVDIVRPGWTWSFPTAGKIDVACGCRPPLAAVVNGGGSFQNGYADITRHPLEIVRCRGAFISRYVKVNH